jgi:glycerophosphoryl diester phosphodiesterase
MCKSQGSGSHMQISSLTAKIVQEMHKNGKIVAIWVDTSAPKDLYEENDVFYKRLYDMGVDMLTTDHPIRA